ncbi:hypothetical protein BH09PAT2_BH09PAT2_09580 [soil metagenome]
MGGLLLLAIAFGFNIQRTSVAHAQTSSVQQMKQLEPDKETNDDIISPKQQKVVQNKSDMQEQDSLNDTDSQSEDAN